MNAGPDIYTCPVHGQVWRYIGPEGDCAHCINGIETPHHPSPNRPGDDAEQRRAQDRRLLVCPQCRWVQDCEGCYQRHVPACTAAAPECPICHGPCQEFGLESEPTEGFLPSTPPATQHDCWGS